MYKHRLLASYSKLPPNVVSVIDKYEKQISQTPIKGSTQTITLNLDVDASNLREALVQGVSYRISNNNIYIWYKPEDGVDVAGFYLLLGFEIIGQPTFKHCIRKTVKFTLSKKHRTFAF